MGPDELAIAVFGFTRSDNVRQVLRSLELQGAGEHVHVWIDGHQGDPRKRGAVERTAELARELDGAKIYPHHGNLGFRKMLLTALRWHCERHRHVAVLEDDCFPTSEYFETMKADLAKVDADESLFSCYGSHFGVPVEETGRCPRFQGWGWAAPTRKLAPILDRLIELYSMTEFDYLDAVRDTLTPTVLERLEVTPGRNPTDTLGQFFAWDETLAMLCAERGLDHKPMNRFCVRNFGMGADSTHFGLSDIFREPPFNMVAPGEVWEHF